jgi:hypothetical protein
MCVCTHAFIHVHVCVCMCVWTIPCYTSSIVNHLLWLVLADCFFTKNWMLLNLFLCNINKQTNKKFYNHSSVHYDTFHSKLFRIKYITLSFVWMFSCTTSQVCTPFKLPIYAFCIMKVWKKQLKKDHGTVFPPLVLAFSQLQIHKAYT